MRTRIGTWGPVAGAILALALTAGVSAARPLGVEVWNDRGDDALYRPGEPMQVKARVNDDAYLLVYQIDAEGNVSSLYPWRRSSALVEGRRTYRIPPEDSREELVADQQTGEGFIVAIASRQPFRDLPWYLRPVDPQAESNGYEDQHAEEEGFDESGKVVGDPMVAMERIRRRVLGRPDDDEDFATSYTRYYIGHEVRYPRYLCSDCHRPGQWAWWDDFDPYYSRCSVFDFRVNWNWAWGPSMWHGYSPYFYYTVRSDCPPHYRRWYDSHDRWSSWDGRRRWTDLWGPDLTRHKTPPPVGYVPPPPRSDFRPGTPGPPRTPPPGYTPPGFITRDYGRGVPIGRNRQPGEGDTGGDGGRGSWRNPGPGATPSPGVMPGERPGREPAQPAPGGDSSPGERPGRVPARREPPSGTPPSDLPPKDVPGREPARREPPRVDPQPRSQPPTSQPPSYQPPRREPSRRDPPAAKPRSSGAERKAERKGDGGEKKERGGRER